MGEGCFESAWVMRLEPSWMGSVPSGNPLPLVTTWGHSEPGASSKHEICRHLALALPRLQTVENKCCSSPSNLYYFHKSSSDGLKQLSGAAKGLSCCPVCSLASFTNVSTRFTRFLLHSTISSININKFASVSLAPVPSHGHICIYFAYFTSWPYANAFHSAAYLSILSSLEPLRKETLSPSWSVFKPMVLSSVLGLGRCWIHLI